MLDVVVDTERLTLIAEQLTPLPEAVARLNELTAVASPNLRTIEDVVARDPVLAAAVLHAANSAMYARQRSASTINDAILRIGLTGLVGVSMRIATASSMRGDLPLYGMQAGQLFDHAVRSSIAAETLRRHAPGKVPAPATVAALLHDTGKIVLNRLVGDRFAELVSELAAGGDSSQWQIEREIFGADHAAVAVHLGRHWRLPLAIVDGMVNHHQPENGTAVAHAVNVADAMVATTLGEDLADDASVRASLAHLAIEFSDFDMLCERALELFDQNPFTD
jgi:HD-like signal output (HDOD) protein